MTQILYPSQLEGQLKALRLPGMAKAFSTRLKQAESGKLSHAELVGLLCEDEVNARADNKALQNCSCDRTSFGDRASSSYFPFYIWHW
jgi:IstB-like ATP binding protein